MARLLCCGQSFHREGFGALMEDSGADSLSRSRLLDALACSCLRALRGSSLTLVQLTHFNLSSSVMPINSGIRFLEARHKPPPSPPPHTPVLPLSRHLLHPRARIVRPALLMTFRLNNHTGPLRIRGLREAGCRILLSLHLMF